MKHLLKRLCRWFFSKKALPYWCVLVADCFLVLISGLLVYSLKYGIVNLLENFSAVVIGLTVCLAAYAVSFYVFHTYNGILRYSSFVDLHRLAYSTATSGFLVCLLHQAQVHFGWTQSLLIPRFHSALLMFIVATMFMWMMRVVVKSLHDMFGNSDNASNVFIYGSMEGGVALAKSIRSEKPTKFHIAGFITHQHETAGGYLMGAKIYLDSDELVEVMIKKKVRYVLISPLQKEYFATRTTLIDRLLAANIKILLTSSVEVWDGKSEINHTQLHELEIEDLLPREKIEVDMTSIGKLLTGRSILITGAAGSIGSEMVRQVALYHPSQMILVDQAETPMHDIRLMMQRDYSDIQNLTVVASITDKDHMETIFSEHRPEYVFHAAAYKHVPMMEDNPMQAVRNNINGTRIIADLAVQYGTKKFVMISTDKAVNPTNVMGCSKRICEIYCQSLNQAIVEGKVKGQTQFVTTRFGNVLGSNGSVIPLFKEQIKNGGPVTVTHKDIIRYFMLIPEACKLVLEAGTMGQGGEIFVFDMGQPVKIVDLAERMIKLSGAKNIDIKFTGLRDGEKLYEEVLNAAENTLPTTHPKIMRAKVRQYDYEEACRNEDELMTIANTHDDMAIVRKMKQIVPEYKSKQSRYEVLDVAE